jgi:dynein heavy chain, axonemal
MKVSTDEELLASVKTSSNDAASLFKWASCSLGAYWIFKDVEPKRKKAEAMRKAKIEGERLLKETKERVAKLTADCAILQKTMKEKQDELDGYIRESNEMTRKLNAASQLINGLAGEQKRWGEEMEKIKEDKIKLVGDCLTGSAFLSYCGPFNSVLRQKMIFDTWKPDIVEKELPCKEDFRLETFLTSEVEISQWASESLPTDELSVQNGILTTKASRWPLAIDPQMQAVTWIKEKEKRNQFDILNFN